MLFAQNLGSDLCMIKIFRVGGEGWWMERGVAVKDV